MKWTAISGSWRITNQQVENDVRQTITAIIEQGNGIVSGGAIGVDYIATDQEMKLDKDANRIKIFIPTTLKVYARHYHKRANQGVITKAQAESLISQLTRLKHINPSALIENPANKTVTEAAYYERNSDVVNAADELIAFQVNKSLGTQDAINKAKEKGIPIKVFKYNIYGNN